MGAILQFDINNNWNRGWARRTQAACRNTLPETVALFAVLPQSSAMRGVSIDDIIWAVQTVKRTLSALGLALLAAPQLVYAAKSNTEQMLSLSPETRLEQRCDARAMGAVGREHRGFKPDEFVAYAFADPVTRGHMIAANGAALRSHGVWYHAAYRCETSDDGLEIKSFSYTLGAPVPRQDWDKHYLVP